MRILVIGGFGHIGRFLVPKLAEDGHDIVVATRGRQPPPDEPSWRRLSVRHVRQEYGELVASSQGRAALAEVQPAAVIDILGRDAPALLAALPASVQHLVVCGSVWMYGPPVQIPTPEKTQGPCPFEAYRRRYEQLGQLLQHREGPVISAVMPSNIAGPGKVPLEPRAGRDIQVHRAMAEGQSVMLPGDGNTLVGPADAEDVAEVFRLVVREPARAAGQMFNAAAAYAVTFNRLVAIYGQIYGKPLAVEHVDWPTYEAQFRSDLSVRYHHEQHMCADITKARIELGYRPRYSPEAAIERAVAWMRSAGLLGPA
jgi:nucleoside-diphosphate-sugar epimerase